MNEEQSEQRDQAVALDVISSVYSLVKSLGLYDANNDAIKRLMDALYQSLETHFTEGGELLKIQLLEEEFFVNGKLLRVDAKSYERAKSLADFLIQQGLGEMTFYQGITPETILAFSRDLEETIRSGSLHIKMDGYGTMTMAKSSGQSVASFRFYPDKLALWLYGGLLDLVDLLYHHHNAGKTPSLLPVKRTLQLVIDATKEHSAVYQALAAIRSPKQPVDITRIRVSAAIEAICFGHYLNLPPTALMTLALGAMLGGLSASSDPEEALEPLYKFPGLGDAAMPLALAIHDTRAAKLERGGGVPGRILAVTEIYVELTSATQERPAIAPAKALHAMVEGKAGAQPGPARMFADHKGPYPIGSPLKLSNGSYAVVVAHGKDEASRKRPIVARIQENGKLGDRFNLLERASLKIEDTPSPADIELNLASS